jgi:hypothetical protein
VGALKETLGFLPLEDMLTALLTQAPKRSNLPDQHFHLSLTGQVFYPELAPPSKMKYSQNYNITNSIIGQEKTSFPLRLEGF